jgi:hypothetical protein
MWALLLPLKMLRVLLIPSLLMSFVNLGNMSMGSFRFLKQPSCCLFWAWRLWWIRTGEVQGLDAVQVSHTCASHRQTSIMRFQNYVMRTNTTEDDEQLQQLPYKTFPRWLRTWLDRLGYALTTWTRTWLTFYSENVKKILSRVNSRITSTSESSSNGGIDKRSISTPGHAFSLSTSLATILLNFNTANLTTLSFRVSTPKWVARWILSTQPYTLL